MQIQKYRNLPTLKLRIEGVEAITVLKSLISSKRVAIMPRVPR